MRVAVWQCGRSASHHVVVLQRPARTMLGERRMFIFLSFFFFKYDRYCEQCLLWWAGGEVYLILFAFPRRADGDAYDVYDCRYVMVFNVCVRMMGRGAFGVFRVPVSFAGAEVRGRQTERRDQPLGGARDRRRAAAHGLGLRDGQLQPLHVVRDAPQVLRVHHLVPGHHQAVQLRVGRAERQHHVVADRLPDVHRARELAVLRHLHQRTCGARTERKAGRGR